MTNNPIRNDNLEQLKLVSIQLYRLARRFKHSDELWQIILDAHFSLEDIVDEEQAQRENVQEEIKKFTEGFAYESPKGSCIDDALLAASESQINDFKHCKRDKT